MFNHKHPKEKLGALVTKSVTAVQTIKQTLNQKSSNYSVTMFAQNNLNHESIRKQAEETEGSIKQATSAFFSNTARADNTLALSSFVAKSKTNKE